MKCAKWIALVLSLVLLLCTMAGCVQKTPQTADGFTSLMEKAGLTVKVEVGSNDDMTTAVLSASNDCFKLFFFEYTSSRFCKKVFELCEEHSNDVHSLKSLAFSKSYNLFETEYNYYAYNHEGSFYVFSRINHTMILCEADAQYRSEITELLKTLGYK